MTAGSVNVDKFYIGDTTDGAFTLPSGLTVTSNTLTVGQSGYGSLTQTGGSNHAQTLTLAAASNVAGTDTLSGGVLDVGTITSGVGTSKLNVDGGTLNITGGRVNVNAFNVGSAAGAAGSFMLTAGLAQAANNETVGNGSFTQSGGSNAISQVLQLGGSAKGSCTLAVGRMATAGSSTGTFSLDGGTLAVSSGLIAVTNFNVGNGAGSNASFALISGGTLSVPSAWTNSGMIGFGDAASTLAGGVITNSGMLQGAGAVASAIINAGTVESVAGVLALIGPTANQASGILRADAGSKLLASGGITANAGLISLAGGTVDTGSSALASAGRIIGFGVLGTGGLNNNGVATFSGGTTTVHGTVTNAAAATMEVAHSAAVFTDAVTNYGNFKATQATFAPARHAAGAHWAFKATQATFAFAGGYTEHGSFVSDPSTNTFSNLSGDTTASLSWQVGDVWNVSGRFINQSTQNVRWNTAAATLVLSGSALQLIDLAGVDLGASAAGYANNFAWGELSLSAGGRIALRDGNAALGAARCVGVLQLAGGTAQINSIASRYNISYDASLAANSDLGDPTYALVGGGLLAPIDAVPEPATAGLLIAGLAVLLARGRHPCRRPFTVSGAQWPRRADH